MAHASSHGEPNRNSSAQAVHFTPAEPRRATARQRSRLVQSRAERYPDEYLFDGGDRDLPVHYGRFFRYGLDTADTVGEYVDGEGEEHLEPTNRVAIYAPRFAAVRTVSGPQEDLAVTQLARADKRTQGVGLRKQTAVNHRSKRLKVGGIRVRSRASGIERESRQAGVSQVSLPVKHTKLLGAFEDLSFVQTGQFKQGEEARLATGLQAAAVWTRDRYPVISAQTEQAQAVRVRFKAREYVGLEDKRKTEGRLRIVKLADKETASPGETVTFTIRYDNVGQKPLFHVRIVDNLTPRLQYVEDSATSDRAGRLVVEDNQEGSLVLRFELAEPLPGGEGGALTFQARVR